MSLTFQFNILLASISVLLGIVSSIFLFRGGSRFYPSRTKIHNLLKRGFLSYVLGNLYSVYVILYAEARNFANSKEIYLSLPGIGLMVIGVILVIISQKKLAQGQENRDIIVALQRIKTGQYFLLLPFLCVVAHFFFGLPIIVWLLATIVGYILMLVGSYQLREVKLFGLIETVVIINLVVFGVFLFTIIDYNNNNLQEEFLEIEIDTISENLEAHFDRVISRDIIENYSEETNQAVLAEFANELTNTAKINDILVWDLEGRIIYSDQADLIDSSSLQLDPEYITAKNGEIIYQVFDEDQTNNYAGLSDYRLKLYYPIRIGEYDKQIGVVGVFLESAISSNRVWSSIAAVWTLGGGLLIFFIIMLVIDLLIMRKAIIIPLRNISKRAKSIVENNDYREHTVIEYESDNEIGQIAKAINKLSFRLAQEEKSEEHKKEDDWHK